MMTICPGWGLVHATPIIIKPWDGKDLIVSHGMCEDCAKQWDRELAKLEQELHL
jgi:hypothetical protein